MPLLSIEHVEDLLRNARRYHQCVVCDHHIAMDYCRTCDEFYWIHQPGCAMFEDRHYGHRLTIVPFVEER